MEERLFSIGNGANPFCVSRFVWVGIFSSFVCAPQLRIKALSSFLHLRSSEWNFIISRNSSLCTIDTKDFERIIMDIQTRLPIHPSQMYFLVHLTTALIDLCFRENLEFYVFTCKLACFQRNKYLSHVFTGTHFINWRGGWCSIIHHSFTSGEWDPAA